MNNLEATNLILFLHHSSILFLDLVKSLLYKMYSLRSISILYHTKLKANTYSPKMMQFII